jgi:hypothetical protein
MVQKNLAKIIVTEKSNEKKNLMARKSLDLVANEKVAQNQFTQAKQVTLLCIKNKFY